MNTTYPLPILKSADRVDAPVALFLIATGKYIGFAEGWLRGVEAFFLPLRKIRVVLITNHRAEDLEPAFREKWLESGKRVSVSLQYQEHRPWPAMTLHRYRMMQEALPGLAGCSHLFYADADTRIIDTVGHEILGQGLTAVIHPGCWNTPRSHLPYETRPASTACIRPNEGTRYFYGAFQGGSFDAFSAAIRELVPRIDTDESKVVVAKWHDESHWNRYLIDHPPTTTLHPGYGFPEGADHPFPRRILALKKDHGYYRSEGPETASVPEPVMPQVPQDHPSGLKILVGICSCARYPEKRQAVRDTWLSTPAAGVQCEFFIGGRLPLEDEPETIVLPVEDTYEALPAKVLAYFAHALATTDFDWLFKCDDDTYVVLDCLHELIPEEEAIVGDESITHRGYPSGGAGYLLSRTMVKKIVTESRVPVYGAEDVLIGKAALDHGAKALASERLFWGAARYPSPKNGMITAHWCSPSRLRAIHAISHTEPIERLVARNSGWTDTLRLYEGGWFSRTATQCSGAWTRQSDESILLDWFDWDHEYLILEDERSGKIVGKSAYADLHADREKKTIAVWLTHGSRGLPHVSRFLASNPGTETHVMYGRHSTENQDGWRNCDRLIRDWWLTRGIHLQFDRVVFLEWDVVFDARIEDILPEGDFVGKSVHRPESSSWRWFTEIQRLPEALREHATGVAPLAVIALSRTCLETMMSNPAAEALFEQDLYCELRLPTLAAHSGFPPRTAGEGLKEVLHVPVTPTKGRGVWHAVKQPVS